MNLSNDDIQDILSLLDSAGAPIRRLEGKFHTTPPMVMASAPKAGAVQPLTRIFMDHHHGEVDQIQLIFILLGAFSFRTKGVLQYSRVPLCPSVRAYETE